MIFRGPLPDIDIPEQSYPDFVLEHAHGLGGKPALIEGATGRTLTYGQLADAVDRVAAGLAQRGLRKGDVVAMDSPNLPEYAVAFLGVARAGGVVTTLNPLFTADEVSRQLSDARARFLITVPALVEKAQAAARASAIEEIYTFGDADQATPFVRLFSADPPPRVDIDPQNDVVVMPYSSGTTGMPKGVMLTHRNLVANVAQTLAVDGSATGDVTIAVLPFFHIYGMVVVMGLVLRAGGTLVTMPRFEMAPFLDILQRYGVTRANLVPPIILALTKHPLVEKYDLSKLEWIMSGAAPLGPELQAACAERLGCQVRQGYGLTETSPVTHCAPAPPRPLKPGTVGPPIPNTEVRIVNMATEEELGPGVAGEVWVRGPQVMKGYFNNPGATRNMLLANGWLRTGDIGRCDEDGYLTIVDRAKELIKYKGYQVAPAELEAILLSHPAIADAAVIGVPDEEAGEVPKAFVVRSRDISADDLMQYVAERVAPYKRVRRVEFRDAIPKSPSGKILRRILVAEERAAAEA